MTFVGRSRRVHLVGTIPAADTRDALGLVLDSVGDSVGDRLPDGETGDRGDWIGRLVEGLREHPDLELVRDGDWSDYGSTPVFRVRPGHRFTSVELDYYDAFTSSWPDFLEARRQLGRNDLAFQVGIPGPIDVAFAAFGFNPLRGLRYTAPFEGATVVEIERIHAEVGDEVVYQLEIPIELEMATRIPTLLRSPGIGWLARRIIRVVERSPESTRWGFHLCVGDMNNTAFSHLEDAAPAVELANALARRFPEGRRLEFIHMPFAHGSQPPSIEASFYTPLGQLRLPDGVRFVAGFVHETQPLETQHRVRSLIEDQIGQPVDVAAACGLGRRDRDAARRNLEQSRQLTE